MNSSICVKGLSHRFGEKVVLNNISFQVEKGEIFGLLGPSGAGKTTLINILTGQLKASGALSRVGKDIEEGGTSDETAEHMCYVLGKPSHNLTGEDYRSIGIMMDNLGLYERMSCYDNLRFYRMLDVPDRKVVWRKEKDAEVKECGEAVTKADGKSIEEVLAGVGLLEAKKTTVMNLSKGMTNRLSFARAIMKSPQILFLDEPTSGLDPTTMEAIHEMILEEKARGTTIFLTTHNMYEAQKLCDKIALLNEGKMVEYGAPAEICRRHNYQKKLHVHIKNGADLELAHDEEAGKLLQEYFAKGEVETIHSTEPNLETIFIELTGRKFEA